MKKFVLMALVLPALVWCLAGCVGSPGPTGPSQPSVPTFQAFGGDTIPCGEEMTVTLWAGQHYDAGDVTVSVTGGVLCVNIQTTGGWVLTETHVAIATSVDLIPQTGSGNPKVGQFLFQTVHNPAVTSFQYCTDPLDYLYEAGNVFIAVHAKVQRLDSGGTVVQTETAWADGLPFPGNNWATYFTYFIEECVGGEECSLTVTYPNGGEEFCAGYPCVITWESAGDAPGPVRIELLQYETVCRVIEESTANVGSYEWTAETCGGGADGYMIRITDLACGAVDASDGPFRIVDCSGGE